MDDSKKTKSQLLEELTVLRSKLNEVDSQEKSEHEIDPFSRNLLESAFGAVILFDSNTEEILDVNTRACEIYGFPRSEFIGKSLKDISENPIAGEQRIRETLLKEGHHHFETIQQGGDGSKIIFEVNASVINYKGKTAILSINRDITDRNRAMDELRESEERYRSLFNQSGDMMVLEDEDERIVDVNNKACSVLGYTREELLAKRTCDLRPEAISIKQTYKKLDIYSNPNDSEQIEVEREVVTGDGVTKTLDITVVPLRMKGKDLFMSIARDITDKKTTESELRESQKKYYDIFEGASDGIIYSDKKGKILEINSKFTGITGIKRDEIIGKNAFVLAQKFVKINDIPRILKLIKENLTTNTAPTPIELNYNEKILEITAHSAKNRAGVTGIIRDITERKLAERALKESEERYRQLFESDLTGDYISTLDGRLITCNKTFQAIFGFSSINEALATPIEELYPHPEERKVFLELLIKDGKLEFYEKDLKHRDGSILHVIENASVVLNKEGEIAQIRGNIIDNTRHKELEEQLRQAQKMEGIGRLAGGIAHDFNNLLTVIQGNSELALLALNPDDPLADDIREIQFASNRATDLTRQLLAFSRRQTLQPKVVNLNEVIKNMQRMLERLIGEDIRLVTQTDEYLWRVKVDPSQMEHVIVNLAVNARDAMPMGGKLTIETSNQEIHSDIPQVNSKLRPGQYVMVEISDNGSGISEELQSQIFDPFFTTKETGKGTGLGLSMVYGIIKQSQGHISVYSKLNRGTTFRIYLPREMEQSVTGDIQSETGKLPIGKERILVVEDEDAVRTLTIRSLKSSGYKVVEARSGADALQICKELDKPVDLVLTDVIMPDINGPDFIGCLLEIWPGIKVLFMSGYAADHIIQDGMIARGMPYIQKPFSPSSLAVKVRAVLDKNLK